MYKDQDKQREANKEQMRRARAKGNTEQGNTIQGNTDQKQKARQAAYHNLCKEGMMQAENVIPERTAQQMNDDNHDGI